MVRVLHFNGTNIGAVTISGNLSVFHVDRLAQKNHSSTQVLGREHFSQHIAGTACGLQVMLLESVQIKGVVNKCDD